MVRHCPYAAAAGTTALVVALAGTRLCPTPAAVQPMPGQPDEPASHESSNLLGRGCPGVWHSQPVLLRGAYIQMNMKLKTNWPNTKTTPTKVRASPNYTKLNPTKSTS